MKYLPVIVTFRIKCTKCGRTHTATCDRDMAVARDIFIEQRISEGWSSIGFADELALCPNCYPKDHG